MMPVLIRHQHTILRRWKSDTAPWPTLPKAPGDVLLGPPVVRPREDLPGHAELYQFAHVALTS